MLILSALATPSAAPSGLYGLQRQRPLATSNMPSIRATRDAAPITASFCDGNTARDLCLIEHNLSQETIPKSCPITQLIPCTPIGLACNNSSLHATGGYCNFAAFWWYIEWPQEVQACTIQHLASRNNPNLIT